MKGRRHQTSDMARRRRNHQGRRRAHELSFPSPIRGGDEHAEESTPGGARRNRPQSVDSKGTPQNTRVVVSEPKTGRRRDRSTTDAKRGEKESTSVCRFQRGAPEHTSCRFRAGYGAKAEGASSSPTRGERESTSVCRFQGDAPEHTSCRFRAGYGARAEGASSSPTRGEKNSTSVCRIPRGRPRTHELSFPSWIRGKS